MTLKYLKKLCLMFIIVVGALCGCNADSGTSTNVENSVNNELVEEQERMREVVLTAEEEKILCAIYINEDRIKEGKLYDYQFECLEQIRFAKDYLLQKYPNNSFEIINCNPMGKMTAITEIMFQEINDVETIYNMQITENNGEYQAEDNYYGCLIREAYDDYFMELLNANGFDGCITYTDFNHVEGMEIDGNLTVQNILDLNSKLGKNTQIFIEGNADIAQAIEEFVKKRGIYGSYNVYVIEDMQSIGRTGLELKEYVSKTKEGLKITYFNCFGK